MARYTYVAASPQHSLIVRGKDVPDGSAVELSREEVLSLVTNGTHFKELDPAEGEPAVPGHLMRYYVEAKLDKHAPKAAQPVNP